jgi:hypothetical protein
MYYYGNLFVYPSVTINGCSVTNGLYWLIWMSYKRIPNQFICLIFNDDDLSLEMRRTWE